MVTEMTGMSTFGRRVIASFWNDTHPKNMMTSASTIAGSGCRIDQAETLTAILRARNVKKTTKKRILVASTAESVEQARDCATLPHSWQLSGCLDPAAFRYASPQWTSFRRGA
jgi:hypothetical protein